MNSKNITIYLALATLAFMAGCATEMGEEQASATAEQAIVQPKIVKTDVEVIRKLSLNTYKDLAASDKELFFLRANGSIEIQTIGAASNPNPTIIPGNFEAIDYVTGANNTWGLIAIDNETRTIFANAHTPSQRKAIGNYPDGVTVAEDIAGISGNTNVLQVYLRQELGGVHSFYSAGMHTRPAPTIPSKVEWDAGTFGEANYTDGFTTQGFFLVTARNYSGDGHLLHSFQRSQIVTTEALGNYTEHGYTLNGVTDRFTPVGIDYAAGYFYAIDRFDADGSQVLVKLGADKVTW